MKLVEIVIPQQLNLSELTLVEQEANRLYPDLLPEAQTESSLLAFHA